MSRLFFIFLLIFATFTISSNLTAYQTRFDESYWREVYNHSQYCVPNCEFRGNIDDPELYTLAGLSYLRGEDPSLINPEVQPLTKYLYGLSTLIFGNALPVQLGFLLGSLYLLYLLAKRLLPVRYLLLPPLLLVIDPLVNDQLLHPYVDLSIMFYLLLIVHFLIRQNYARDWWWGALSLGALSASKSFSLGLLFALPMLYYFFVYDKKNFFSLAFRTLFGAALLYLLVYLPYFLHQHSLLDFLSLHLDILRLYKAYVPEYPKGEILRIIFTGQWRTWWGDKGLIPSPFFTPLWALATLSLPIAYLASVKSPKKTALNTLIIISTLWLVFISLRLVFPRYLTPILPLLYLVLTSLVSILFFRLRKTFLKPRSSQ